LGGGAKVLLEYVSANPTGPVTIAAARQASVGDSLARILKFTGHEVTREYYVNDTGGQIVNLGLSIRSRWSEIPGLKDPFPEQGYHGDYVKEIAQKIWDEGGKSPEKVTAEFCSRKGRDLLMDSIRADLKAFGVEFDVFTSQEALEKSGKAAAVVETLRSRGLVFEQDGAQWLRTTRFGDDKDRVLVKSGGDFTYRTPDLAYHKDKFDRGFDRLVDIMGPDHHQHAKELALGLQALGYDAPKRLKVLFIEHCRLMRAGEEVKMSKRLATYVTLRELIDEVGVDAARWFFTMRKAESHLDFDIETAKKRSLDNPVYYAQYAHARICSIYEKGVERGHLKPAEAAGVYSGPGDAGRLGTPELDLLRRLERFPAAVEGAAADLDTTRVTSYLYDLSGAFQAYYDGGNRNPELRVIVDDAGLSRARLRLAGAVQRVLQTGFGLLGVSAPRRM
jgi:arginyl-tRNA synthetase